MQLSIDSSRSTMLFARGAMKQSAQLLQTEHRCFSLHSLRATVLRFMLCCAGVTLPKNWLLRRSMPASLRQKSHVAGFSWNSRVGAGSHTAGP